MKKMMTVFFALMMIMGCISSIPTLSSGVVNMLPVPTQGELYSLSLRYTLQGINDCMNGAMGTGVLQNPKYPESLLFVWKIQANSWAFVGVNVESTRLAKDLMVLRANYSNLTDYRTVIKTLTDAGWGSVSYKIVEGNLKNPILMATIVKIMDMYSGKMITFLMMPAGFTPEGDWVLNYEKIPAEYANQ
jgi:hypothetical protein